MSPARAMASAPRGKAPLVPGFDYTTGKAVSMTAKEWRKKYPPSKYTRATASAQGETWYRFISGSGFPSPRLSAEAYAIIPAGRAKA